jgi:hypothetical protein
VTGPRCESHPDARLVEALVPGTADKTLNCIVCMAVVGKATLTDKDRIEIEVDHERALPEQV